VRVPEADEIPAAREAGHVASASANLHRRVVELFGDTTLSLLAGMLDEIRTPRELNTGHQTVSKSRYEKTMKSYLRLVELVVVRDGGAAEIPWRKYMETSAYVPLTGTRDGPGPRQVALSAVAAKEPRNWNAIRASARLPCGRRDSPVDTRRISQLPWKNGLIAGELSYSVLIV